MGEICSVFSCTALQTSRVLSCSRNIAQRPPTHAVCVRERNARPPSYADNACSSRPSRIDAQRSVCNISKASVVSIRKAPLVRLVWFHPTCRVICPLRASARFCCIAQMHGVVPNPVRRICSVIAAWCALTFLTFLPSEALI